MTEQKLRVFLWVCLAHLIYYSATAEIPKECAYGTADYNETLCNETCTKTMKTNESYCSNFTHPIANKQNSHEQDDVANPVALSGIMTSTVREGSIHVEITTPKIDINESSSAVSVEASLKGSAVASLCILFFAYF